ncbi:MAG: alpha/beta hydrolase, partial [Mycobacterium sp.]
MIPQAGIAGEASATPESDAGAAPDGGMSPPSGALDWGGCASFIDASDDIPAARCTMVAVPVDYQRPGGEHANLAVIRIPATGQRIGSLLVNPGGPGA